MINSNNTLTRHKTTSLNTFIQQLKEYIAATPLYDNITYQLTLRDNTASDKTIRRRIKFTYDGTVDNPLPNFTACHTYQFSNSMMNGHTITHDTGANAERLVYDELFDRRQARLLTQAEYSQECEKVNSDTDIEFVLDFLSKPPFISQLIYCYDHSDRVYSTKPFNDRFDSGTVAVAFVNISNFYNYDNNGNVTNPDTAEKNAREYLDSAVESWLHWLNNEYYCAQYLYPLTRCEHTTYTDEDGRVQYEINKTEEMWDIDFRSSGYTDDTAYDAISSTYYIKNIIDITLVDEENN